jgi:predicted ATPase/DNA-binding CsgD family transcriptional regulator
MARPISPLVGRDDDVRDLVALVRDPAVRLITLVGPGGVGKTRLALAAMDEAAPRFADGVVAVDLSGVRDPALVGATIATSLGVREATGLDVEETLAATLAERRMMLVLDNFEQVVEAAPVLTRLFAACPGVHAMVTSRERLRLGGERVVAVRPLAVSAGGNLLSPAAALFLERARAARADFRLSDGDRLTIEAICTRLDGLPLAIELAAAWVATLPPQALLERLQQGVELLADGARDAPERQRTMRAAVAWSEGLLTDDERDAFRRLAVFPSGFTLEGAAAVLKLADLDALRLIGMLADRHLLRPLGAPAGDPRFTMLETVRAFAREGLAADEAAEPVRDRLLDWCVGLVERGVLSVGTAEQGIWLQRVDLELDSMRAALAWGLDRGDARVVRLAGGLWRYWFTRGLLSEGRRWSEDALARCGDGSEADRARALQGIGALAQSQGDYAAAAAALDESLRLYRGLGHAAGLATSLNQLGQTALGSGEVGRAVALHEEALRTAREAADDWRTTYSLNLLAVARLRAGDPAAAGEAAAAALSIARSRGDNWGLALALASLGRLALADENLDVAERDLNEALSLQREIGDRRGTVAALTSIAAVAKARGDSSLEAARLAEAAAITRAVGERRALARMLIDLGAALARAGDEAAARAHRAEARAIAAESGDAEAMAAAERLLREGQRSGRDDYSARAANPADAAPDPAAQAGLTAREREVLCLLVDGLTNREIADRLFIGHRTVATHVLNILGKLGIESRTAAAAWAVRQGLA